MPYVNIPVPEEHVEEVMQFVLRTIRQAAMTPWDDASVQEFFGDVDESSRALLAFITRASLAEQELSETAASQAMQMTWQDVFGIVRDLNDRAADLGRPPIIIARIVSEKLPNGRTIDKRVYSIPEEVAPLVEAADRADLLADASPIAGGDAQ
jgi:hypothetical protein